MNSATEIPEASTPEPTPPRKADPETLAIRAAPMRAIRFKRGLIVVLAALAIIALVVVAWIALKPRVFHAIAQSDEQVQPEVGDHADALAGLPKSYGDVPKLGPPLPGDLGKPILEHQQSLANSQMPYSGTPDTDGVDAARQQRLAELKAARQSGLLVQSGARSGETVAAATADVASLPAAGEASKSPLGADGDPNRREHKTAFVSATDASGDVNPHLLTPAASPYMLSAGSVIAASLITGLNSDLPGLVIAQVTENVYDSATGRILLVPQGARLIGSYDSVVAFGQRRALVVWQRIILPDGSSLKVDNVPATDAAGYAGLADKVDFHSWSLLKGAALATLFGVGAELQFSSGSDLVQALRQSTQQSVAHAGDRLTSKSVDIQPTITIGPGTPVRLVVQKDLILAPWRG
ncbi:TrbI/VirB10 family protein [Sphingomonas koreensis]|nr:TrbI/VirB10 family protein [Sphingomonas koreensis]